VGQLQREAITRVIDLTGAAKADIETLLDASLDNKTYYAVLARVEALGADTAKLVGNALARK
jgi:hypothetical protein